MANFARDLTAGFNIGNSMKKGLREREEDAWLEQQAPKVEAAMKAREDQIQQSRSTLQNMRGVYEGLGLPTGGGNATPAATDLPAPRAGDAPAPMGGAGQVAAPVIRTSSAGAMPPAATAPGAAPAGAGATPLAAPAAEPGWLERTMSAVGLGPAKPRMPAWAIKEALFPGKGDADWLSNLLSGGGGVGGVRAPASPSALGGADWGYADGLPAGDLVETGGRLPVTPAQIIRTGGLGSARAGQPPADYMALAQQAGTAHQVPTSLILGVMDAESSFNPRAVSPAGAGGLMQLMPGTAKELNPTGDRFNPQDNVDMGTRYLAQQLASNQGDVRRALMAYHAGPGNLAKGKIGPATRKYVDSVMRKMQGYGAYDAPAAVGQSVMPADDERQRPRQVAM